MGYIAEPGVGALHPTFEGEKWTLETVLSVHYWTPTLISFRTTRSPGFRFTPGHYARLGLAGREGGDVWRPISLVSAANDEALEFLVVLIPGGAFSEALGQAKKGDAIKVEKLNFGFLSVDQLAAGRELWLLASGTGLGPFVSMLRDVDVWRDFKRLIVVHSVRHACELAYRDEICALAANSECAGDNALLTYVPVVTRDPGVTPLASRLTQLLSSGRLEAATGLTLDVTTSRLMICGNPEMARELRQLLSARGFASSRRNAPGQMAFENYWQDHD